MRADLDSHYDFLYLLMSTSLSSRIARAFSTWPNSTAANSAVNLPGKKNLQLDD
jgi:hypothetical protein